MEKTICDRCKEDCSRHYYIVEITPAGSAVTFENSIAEDFKEKCKLCPDCKGRIMQKPK